MLRATTTAAAATATTCMQARLWTRLDLASLPALSCDILPLILAPPECNASLGHAMGLYSPVRVFVSSAATANHHHRRRRCPGKLLPPGVASTKAVFTSANAMVWCVIFVGRVRITPMERFSVATTQVLTRVREKRALRPARCVLLSPR